jgi:hypothetical protein
MEMKKTIGFLIFVLLFGAACIRYVPYGESGPNYPRENTYDRDYGRTDNLDTSYFYDQLQPYGVWVSHSSFGYVWIPRDVGYKWRPYSRGHWAWTDYGWTWVSLERWGWIAFHYGRWGWDRRMGWFWVPDVVWGPSWVAWRWGDAHIGWAPLPPGVDFHPGRGFGRHDWDIPGHHWNFVRGRDFMGRSLDNWILPAERNVTIINLTVFNVNVNIRDNRVFNEGVDIEQVRRQTNKVVDKYALKESPQAGEDRVEGNDVIIYKPKVSRNEASKPKQVIEQEKAVEQFDNEQGVSIYRRVPRAEDAALRQAHDQEAKLMRESQDSEVDEIRRKADDEKAKIQNPVEKQKVDGQVKSRIAELKKKHEEEKADMTERQKAEEAKTKKAPVRKKIDKN